MESGTVLGIVNETLGTGLAVTAAIGDTTLYVLDVAYFSPGGGLLELDDATTTQSGLSYAGVDEAAQALIGLDPLTVGYSADDARVTIYPAIELQYAEVRLDGQQDTVRARVPYSIQQRVTSGYYDESNGETLRVLVELADDGYVVDDIIGNVPDVAVNSLSILDNLQVDGEFRVTGDTPGTVVYESGVHHAVSGQQDAPSVLPTITQDWASVSPFDTISFSDSDYTRAQYNTRRGAYWDTTAGYIFYVGGTGSLTIRRTSTTGLSATRVLGPVSNYYYGSITRIGSYYYVLAWFGPTSETRVLKYDTSWVFQSYFAVTTDCLPGEEMLSEDGTDLWVAGRRTSDGRMRMRRYNVSGVLQETLTSSADYAPDAAILGYSARAADYGAETHVFITDDELNRLRQTNSSGTYDATRTDSPATSHCAGLLWDGANFWVLGDGATGPSGTYSVLYKLEKNYWPAATSDTKWLSYTWYDDAGTTHETTAGPAKSFTGRRRKRWSWNVPTIPSSGVDDPNGVRLYLASGTSEPARTSFWLQSTPGAGIDGGTLTDAILTSGTNPPATNDFSGSDPALIYSTSGATTVDSSTTGVGWELDGSGHTSGFSDVQTFTVDGTWTKPKTGGCTMAEIVLIAAGGGGGSGRRNTASNAAGGGGGGGAGAITRARIPLSMLNGTETVNVGVGGTGGAARTTNVDGQAGGDGTDSKMTVGGVAAFLIAYGGDGGAAGTTAGGTGGGTVGGANYGEQRGTPGGDGATGAGGGNSSATPLLVSNWMREGPTGGGGGGGVTAGGGASAGGNGAGAYDLAGSAGGAGSTAPVAGSTKLAGLAFPGSGGGGSGGRPGTGACRAGAAGGLYGAGGGGGGGGQTVDSGAGGNGGNGIVVVTCY